MKWIKTCKGNIVRLGAVTEFIFRDDGIDILIGTVTEEGCRYSDKEQIVEACQELENYIIQTGENDIFSFPSANDIEFTWLKRFDIDVLMLSVKSYNACRRADIHNLYDLKNKNISNIRGIGEKCQKEIEQKLDDFINKRIGGD